MKENKGLAVIIRSELEFNKIKKFLGETILYLDFVPQMKTTETSIVIWAKKKTNFSLGSVGSTYYQRESGIRCVNFDDYFKFLHSKEIAIKCTGNNGNGCYMDSCGHDCGCEGILNSCGFLERQINKKT